MRNKILLVDDDKSLISALSLYLANQGFNVEVADSVKSALIILDKIFPDLIISDIVMPKQDGYAFLKYLKNEAKYKNIPFIFLSAKGMTIDRILGYNLGCYGYLVKPFDPEELLAIVHNILSDFHVEHIDKIVNQDIDMNIAKHNNALTDFKNFTFREDTVLRCVLKGMTNKEIASHLSLSLRNVEKYVSRLLVKTDTRNRTELTKYFYTHCPSYLEGE